MHGRPAPENGRPQDAEPALPAATEAYEQALAGEQPARYVLVLYVAGSAPRSLRAVAFARRLCDDYLPGCHDLEVVDIYQQPALAEAAGILAVPALIRKLPPPEIMIVGDLSDTAQLVRGLGLSRQSRDGSPEGSG